MKQRKAWSLLTVFGEQAEGEENVTASVHTPQTDETGAEAPLAAGEENTSEAREKAFRALMDGEFKDLFTAYFQETFNRRFKERKKESEELAKARECLAAAADFFGVRVEELGEVLRAENERKRAPTERLSHEMTQAREAAIRQEADEAIERAREETERTLLAAIRARGMRPGEAALGDSSTAALAAGVTSLSREQRAEVARRAAKGERIKF